LKLLVLPSCGPCPAPVLDRVAGRKHNSHSGDHVPHHIRNCCRSFNLLRWDCLIPGKDGTDWAGGFFPLTLEFTEDYPAKPPKVIVNG
jgi:ubiquitin-conjugating enzyme E2 I